MDSTAGMVGVIVGTLVIGGCMIGGMVWLYSKQSAKRMNSKGTTRRNDGD